MRFDGEFAVPNEWIQYCADLGICIEPTTPHSSEMNCITEHGIRTTIADVQTLLIESGLPKSLWAEAAAYSIHTRNMIPSKSIPDKIPLEGWTKRRVDVSYLYTFSCKVYVWIPTDANGRQVNGGSKLDARTENGIFIGYLLSHGGHGRYRILVNDGQIMKSKDVEFVKGPAHRTLVTEEVDEIDPPHSQKGKLVSVTPNELTPPPSQPPTQTITVPESTQPVEGKNPCVPGLPEVTTYWKPTNEKCIPKPTEKVHIAFVSSSPSMDDIIELNRELDLVVTAMAVGYRDLKAPANQKEVYKVDKDHWVEAEVEELKMLKAQGTWELVPLPADKNMCGSQFTYKVKTTGDGKWYKDKVQFIVQGFTMIEGVDFNKTWVAVTRLESIQMTAAFVAAYSLIPWQIDFTSTYLNAEISKEVYMKQCRLLKALYSTRQGGKS